MNYSIEDHIHNYAVWASAKAVQRGFTTTRNIKVAIETSGLKKIIKEKNIKTVEEFDKFHQNTAEGIIKSFKKSGIHATYGRAAKIIAIYIKTVIVIRESEKNIIAKIAHPPIDRVLLKNLHKVYPKLESAGINWTQLEYNEYLDLIKKLRKLDYKNFWEIEKYWEPIADD